ncbi:MAG: hypothetical protein ACPGRZ_03810 [Alphaproteobacteria bacterium]
MEKHLYNYNKIISSYSDNHSEMDFKTFRINIGKHRGIREFPFRIFYRVKFFWNIWSIAIFAFLIPFMMATLYLVADKI